MKTFHVFRSHLGRLLLLIPDVNTLNVINTGKLFSLHGLLLNFKLIFIFKLTLTYCKRCEDRIGSVFPVVAFVVTAGRIWNSM